MSKINNKQRKRYTESELIYLESSWGNVSVQRIASTLGRTVEAVEAKARKMKLGNPLECKDFLIAVEVEELLGVTRKTLQKHLHQRGLKHKVKSLKTRKLVTVKYEDLIEWLLNNFKYWDATKVDKLGLIAIGMDEKIINKKYIEDTLKNKRKKLTDKDVEKIKRMYSEFITYKDIATALGKDCSSVKWKIHSLIKKGEIKSNTSNNRLVRVNNRKDYGWAEWQDKILIKEFRNGKTLKEISEMVGKSLSATKSRNQNLSRRLIKGLVV